MITFTKVRLPYGWLGNMSPHAVTHLGVEWRSTEALFQALRFSESAIQEEIRRQKSPMGAKIVAKQNANSMIVVPMGEEDLKNMDLCLRLKLQHHPDLVGELLATGDEVLVEDITARGFKERNLFWGMGLKDGVWIGQNTLGNMWAKLRTELREKQNGTA